MSEPYTFKPPRSLGIIFHVVLVFLLTGASVWGFWQASQANIGPLFLLYLLPALISIGLVPLLIYRLLALRNAYYAMERDGMRLNWGLRVVEIPMRAVLWARLSAELAAPLPLPWPRWPGAVIGVRHLPDGSRVEFMAASSKRLVLIALPERVYAISPDDPDEFLNVFQSFMEMGSLSPFQARSVHPSFLLGRIWNAPLARLLLLGGLLLNLALLVWVSLAVPSFYQVTLGFGPGREPVPSVRLLLLPFISSSIFLMNFFLGLLFYRRADLQDLAPPASGDPAAPGTGLVSGWVLAYLLWGSGILAAFLFLFALFFTLKSS